MTRVYLRGYAVRDAEMPTEGPIPFILATEGRKEDGLDLRMDRLDLERFLANPLLMYGHQYWGRDSLPIGRVDNGRVEGPTLRGGLVFDQDDDFAVTVERKIRARFLNSVSVGFDAYDIGDDGVPGKWTLFETSVVPLPMDPDAIAEGREIVRSGALGDFADFAGRLAAIERTLATLAPVPAPTVVVESGPALLASSALDIARRRLRLAENGH